MNPNFKLLLDKFTDWLRTLKPSHRACLLHVIVVLGFSSYDLTIWLRAMGH